jgi:NitT/TauT family transport system ATP-binding protein
MSSRIVVMGAHPARIVAEISVDEPYPRAPEFRRSARFHAISVRVADALAKATSDAFEGAKA